MSNLARGMTTNMGQKTRFLINKPYSLPYIEKYVKTGVNPNFSGRLLPKGQPLIESGIPNLVFSISRKFN